MMTTKTFGRRGAAPPIPSPLLRPTTSAAAPTAALDQGSGRPAFEGAILEKSLIADLPLLTAGLTVLLMVIFGVEKHLAFDIGKNGDLSVQSLIAFGAISRDLVVGSGEWWRIGLAPLLHASAWHLLGNCFALFFVGMRLEPMIGRGWFALIFMVSALGGVAGSLYSNPPDLPSVGASGAITGLIGALFVVSFHHRADPVEQRAMRTTSLRFGIPALLPLAIAASDQVDYFAHAGGAIAGGALGLTLCAIWSADGLRPDFARLAAVAALTALAGSIVCCGVAASRYATYAADAAQFIRSSEMPAMLKTSAKRSAELLARYPKDPRSHLLQAVSLVEAHRLSDAEAELRTAMALAPSDAGGRPIRNQAQAILAVVLLEQGRRSEAKTLAAGACHANDQAVIRRILEKMKLCD
jgi:membrane associated rhomboid family serine protease